MTREKRTMVVEDMVLFVTESMRRGRGPRAINLQHMTYFTDDDPALARAVLLRAGFLPDGSGDRWSTGQFAKPLDEVCRLDDLTDILDDHLPVLEDA